MAAKEQVPHLTMQIGEVAKCVSLSVDAIRFYERRRLLPNPSRTAGRFRLYTEDAIGRVQFMQQMQGLGFSLKEVGELLKLSERKVAACEQVKRLMETKLADVRSKLAELRQLESDLDADLRKCNSELIHRQGGTPCPCPVLEEATAGGRK